MSRKRFTTIPICPLHGKVLQRTGVNWSDKFSNLQDIADALSLGTDTFVFVDDNPLECDLVRSHLPEVTVIHLDGAPSLFAKKLLAAGGLHTVVLTDEDRGRVDSYAIDRARAEFAVSLRQMSFLLVSI